MLVQWGGRGVGGDRVEGARVEERPHGGKMGERVGVRKSSRFSLTHKV